MRIAIDTGGTFTDCVYLDRGELRTLKLFSTPDDPGQAVLQAIQAIAAGRTATVRHGTTVGTNALLERRGARTAFVTTAGFEDTIAIGRQARTRLYDWFAQPPPCLVPPELRFGVAERVAADGTSLLRPQPENLANLSDRIRTSGAESIAVSLLFSFANPEHERLVGDSLRPLGLPISLSHRILPEFREFERGATVAVNAYLAPKVGSYVQRLDEGGLEVMQSSGGIIPARFAAEQPVRTVLSGPAGGVVGAYYSAKRAGIRKVIAFDMGGTSTDVSLIDLDRGGPLTTNEAMVAGLPIAVPTLDIHTVGAGGGSIARFDQGGLLRVGPESAGANPGPICYGRGTEPTVSDANVVLGRLVPEHFLGGEVKLDGERTRSLMDRCRSNFGSVEEFAAGIVQIAEVVMAQAIRVISVERGHDPREFTLVAFGGAGPLHACALAEELSMTRVMIPVMPGALSAMGILLADETREYSKTVMAAEDANLEPAFQELEQEAAGGERSRWLEVRYAGQGYELKVPAGDGFAEQFHKAHRQRYGYSDERNRLEIVTLRLQVRKRGEELDWQRGPEVDGDGLQAVVGERVASFEGGAISTRVYGRGRLGPGDHFEGPAIVVEYSATTVVLPGWHLRVDAGSNLILEREG